MHNEPMLPADRNTVQDSYTFDVAKRGVDPVARPTARHRQQSHRPQRQMSEGRSLLLWCGIPILVVLLVRIFLFGAYSIPTKSMMNTINPGDRVFTSKLTARFGSLQRGDVIVFRDPAHWLQDEGGDSSSSQYLIKRLIGLPGDVVACQGVGKPVTINVRHG